MAKKPVKPIKPTGPKPLNDGGSGQDKRPK